MKILGYMTLNGWGPEAPAAAITDLPADEHGRPAIIRADGPYRLFLAYEFATPDLTPEQAVAAATEDADLARFVSRAEAYAAKAAGIAPKPGLPEEIW